MPSSPRHSCSRCRSLPLRCSGLQAFGNIYTPAIHPTDHGGAGERVGRARSGTAALADRLGTPRRWWCFQCCCSATSPFGRRNALWRLDQPVQPRPSRALAVTCGPIPMILKPRRAVPPPHTQGQLLSRCQSRRQNVNRYRGELRGSPRNGPRAADCHSTSGDGLSDPPVVPDVRRRCRSFLTKFWVDNRQLLLARRHQLSDAVTIDWSKENNIRC